AWPRFRRRDSLIRQWTFWLFLVGLALAGGQRFGSQPPVVKAEELPLPPEVWLRLRHPDSVHSVSFSPADKLLAPGSYDGTVRLWDLATGREIRTLKGHEKPVESVAFSPDGKALASGSFDKTIRL